jgi:hypothetical protein
VETGDKDRECSSSAQPTQTTLVFSDKDTHLYFTGKPNGTVTGTIVRHLG